jgi:hypothetical protein
VVSRKTRLLSSAFVLIQALAPSPLLACACGCGVFDVGTAAMLPTRPGGMAYLEFDGMNQDQNWSGTAKASADANPDKQIRTGFFTAGVQVMLDRRWGFIAELPYWSRYFKTTGDDGAVAGFTHSAVGDFRIKGVYSGFSSDMSSGLTFGFKLPTGDFSYPNFDRDTQIGTGSTDLLVGAYRTGMIADSGFNWFVNAQWDQPLLTAGGYRPGAELDAVLGTYFDRWKLGGVKVAPTAQAVGSARARDGGTLANPADSGYTRVLLSPGLEIDAARVRVVGDVGFPVFQKVNGSQLAAAELFRLNVGYPF